MKKIIFILFMACFCKAYSNKLEKAYQALSIYDYFKAKQLFTLSLSKFPSESSFGLAVIFYRNDNPFSNIDSAAKYIAKCGAGFTAEHIYSKFRINQKGIDSMSVLICDKGFNHYVQKNEIEPIEHFLNFFYFSKNAILNSVFHLRDSLKYAKVLSHKSSDSITNFLYNYPQTDFYLKAQQDYYNFQYKEVVNVPTQETLKYFLKYYPKNPNKIEAELALFEIIKNLHSADSLHSFIKKYSSIHTQETAWKTLYSLSVKNYNKEDLSKFLNTYPEYPYNETVVKEILLSQKALIPIEAFNEKVGFIDTLGNWIINPVYDDALPFSEGLASVSKNDSCFYINKEGNLLFPGYFDEAYSFKKGIAIVKKANLFYLINRSGQIISRGYDDISESSDHLFVCKLNEFYGAINDKGEVLIPFSYHKLGRFKNGYAYYLSDKYGLISSKNNLLAAQWDWVSDVDSNNVAIVKKDNKYGIINIKNELILNTDYDYILPCQNEIFLIMKNNLYGFYNVKETCFITTINYNYAISNKPSYYTNGKYFKLIKDNEVALIDANGRYSINFGQYSNLFFASCDVIRIQKNTKYGYVDRKLKAITPLEFDAAEDFVNDVAIVKKAGSTMLIDKQNKALYTGKDVGISLSLASDYLIKQNELLGLMNKEGKLILNIEYDSINYLSHGLYRCAKGKEIFLFDKSNQIVKKLN